MFQFTRPRGARLHGACDAYGHVQVSIHAPTGGATLKEVVKNETTGFNSRAHGGRDVDSRCRFPCRVVSIHAPTGGATCRGGWKSRPRRFQFTRPRGARPKARVSVTCDSVSIHAPTGGATEHWPPVGVVDGVSIHAPTGGATRRAGRRYRSWCFNSRAHGGRDAPLTLRRRGKIYVSIHAPTGGATYSPTPSCASCWFQFTRPRGARLAPTAFDRPLVVFQFTRPRGARRRRATRWSPSWVFQFTRPRGARLP